MPVCPGIGPYLPTVRPCTQLDGETRTHLSPRISHQRFVWASCQTSFQEYIYSIQIQTNRHNTPKTETETDSFNFRQGFPTHTRVWAASQTSFQGHTICHSAKLRSYRETNDCKSVWNWFANPRCFEQSQWSCFAYNLQLTITIFSFLCLCFIWLVVNTWIFSDEWSPIVFEG